MSRSSGGEALREVQMGFASRDLARGDHGGQVREAGKEEGC